jgi:hypothetical protein
MKIDPGGWYRRLAPRVGVQAFCSELLDGAPRHGLVVELAPGGVRIERPYTGGGMPREVNLELEVPEVDEIIWARAAVCYDWIRPAPRGVHAGPFGFVRTTGLRFTAAAGRDLRLVRDCAFHLSDERSESDLIWGRPAPASAPGPADR